jgi:hypothetical protein
MRLPTLLLVVLLPLCGCDIFLEDWGVEGAPCGELNDCQKGMICDQHICRKSPDQVEFGEKCNPMDPPPNGHCGGEFGQCVCFPDHNCYCTRPCDGPHNCDDLSSGARCTLVDPFIYAGFCAHPQWTEGYGTMCNHGDVGCITGICADFPVDGLQLCSVECIQGSCPEGLMCLTAAEPPVEVCGFPLWFGFWHECTNNTNCDVFPLFKQCFNNSNCTTACAGAQDCPATTRCEPHTGGECVPDVD